MPLTDYLGAVQNALAAGNATEHTHRPALKAFLESLGGNVTATNEPRREECGAPDYVVSVRTKHGPLTIGYVEAKDVGAHLDEVERSEQLSRYRKYLSNLVLTDYLEFRWYVEGEPRAGARLGRVGRGGRIARDEKGAAAVEQLLRAFLEHQPADIASPQDLAGRMARLTHMMRDIIVAAIQGGRESEMLCDLRSAFAQTLIPDLDQPEKAAEFADMYAQTIAYGLFAARCNHRGPEVFRRVGAAAEIPRTNPFLRRLFETITGSDLDQEPYAGFVEDLADLLARADMGAVLEHFGRRTRREDPVVHFYETFLAAYNPQLRETRGVYFTPEPVVSFIVRSVDHLLKTEFNCPDGLGDTSTCQIERQRRDGKTQRQVSPRVLILDPACGTGTFLYAVVDHVREQFMARGDAGMWSGYVRDHLLPRLFGFELLMAPYAVAHFKLGMQLAGQDLPSDALRQEWAYDFAGGAEDRLRVYLTNTLEGVEHEIQQLLGLYRIISDEANAAREVKRDLPIMVVLGNPPYSGHSANRSWIARNGRREPTFIGGLIQDYQRVDGEPLGERNPKWLQDDYVKFIRWGTWRIERTGCGILALITNHGYLDNPTFRGMRESLMAAFDDIYILDLHGSVKKKETAPDGSKDENVFDIQPGVAIGVFVKRPGAAKKKPATVRHVHLRGPREIWKPRAGGRRELAGGKHAFLLEHDLATAKWKVLKPRSPFYLFVPQDVRLRQEYEACWKITAMMPVNVLGFQTHRDHFAIDLDAEALERRIAEMRDKRISDHDLAEKHDLKDNRDWHLAEARDALRGDASWRDHLLQCLYRPFDRRACYFSPVVMDFPRRELLTHVARKENYCLGLGRQGLAVNDPQWSLVTVSRDPVDANVFRRGGVNLFPLFLYPNPDRNGEFFANGTARHANLSPEFLADIRTRLRLSFVADGCGDLKKTFGPEDVLHYGYAVLHSPTYRQRYAEFLKIDFPRVPLTSDLRLFRKLCGLGGELVALHLLESAGLSPSHFITRYPIPGDNVVEKGHPKYLAPGEPAPGTGKPLRQGRVYVSKEDPAQDKKGQHFEGVPPRVWEFHIGGYRVCEKWLKDRRGRQLSFEDLTHYQKVIVAIQETIRLMEEIDAAIPKWPLG